MKSITKLFEMERKKSKEPQTNKMVKEKRNEHSTIIVRFLLLCLLMTFFTCAILCNVKSRNIFLIICAKFSQRAKKRRSFVLQQAKNHVWILMTCDIQMIFRILVNRRVLIVKQPKYKRKWVFTIDKMNQQQLQWGRIENEGNLW